MQSDYVPSLPPAATPEHIGAWTYEELLRIRAMLDELSAVVAPVATVSLTSLWDAIIELRTRVDNCDCAETSTDFTAILDAEGRLLLDARGGYVQEA